MSYRRGTMQGVAHRTLAQRLGKTVHASPLRFKIGRLRAQYPCAMAPEAEDWLMVVANTRGARVVIPPFTPDPAFCPPDEPIFSNAELIVAICQLNGLDRPQLLRLAAQLLSRGDVNMRQLRQAAERERAEPVLAELSRQALKIDPHHGTWRQIQEWFGQQQPLREPLLHWTRLAEPLMAGGRCNAARWRLVA